MVNKNVNKILLCIIKKDVGNRAENILPISAPGNLFVILVAKIEKYIIKLAKSQKAINILKHTEKLSLKG